MFECAFDAAVSKILLCTCTSPNRCLHNKLELEHIIVDTTCKVLKGYCIWQDHGEIHVYFIYILQLFYSVSQLPFLSLAFVPSSCISKPPLSPVSNFCFSNKSDFLLYCGCITKSLHYISMHHSFDFSPIMLAFE